MGLRRRRNESRLIDLVAPVAALLVLGFLFSPQFRQLLVALLYLMIGLVSLVVVGLLARIIWKRVRGDGDSPPALPANPPQAASGHVNLMPLPVAPQPQWDLELLKELEWKRFEEVVAAYSRELGYEARTTRIGADGGVDVQLFRNGQMEPVMIIQCKAWDAYKVGVKPVRELFGVMAADKVPNGAFFTTGEFTAEAESWARDKNLDLVDGREFLARINQLSPSTQEALYSLATEGDYTTPTCPSCDVKMLRRTAGKGRSEGSAFWGCRNYPRCRQTFRIAQTS